MKKCPFCAEDIQDAAIVCKHCGRELTKVGAHAAPSTIPKTSLGKVVGILVLLLVIAGTAQAIIDSFSGAGSASSTRGPASDPAKVKELSDFVDKATAAGLIHRLNVNLHEVQVNPMLWAYFDVNAKKEFAISLAAYCALNSADHDLRYVDIVDAQSGKKLAAYGASGFSVY